MTVKRTLQASQFNSSQFNASQFKPSPACRSSSVATSSRLVRGSLLVLSAFFATGILSPATLWANEWDSLGSSQALIQKAKALDPKNKLRVVQKRAVDRDLRLELSGHYGLVTGGDSYVSTQTGGGQLEFHINPKWSLGLRANTYFNNLTAEGNNVFREAQNAIQNGNPATLPEINHPQSSMMGTISWYPIYGKLNLFDHAITQFDLYLLAGYGTLQLASREQVPITSVGGGVGLWFTQHVMGRAEIRYQGYQDKVYENPSMNTMVMQLSLGFLL